MRKLYISLAVFLVLAIIGFSLIFLDIYLVNDTVEIKIKDVPLEVEVVYLLFNAKRGLMWRFYLPGNRGMLFVGPDKCEVGFWMKNTFIPLSIAFVDEDMNIISIQKMKPLDTSIIYRSPSPYKYAIEANQGWFETNLIAPGDRISLGAGTVLNRKK